eukprot:CAMPEP_0204363184 /NCGR_PEP_ID=MMETSP0469-20131031/40186_1 /ASSEMBLY_ACC=CAM_ASM_000384 /TAXON_ID=2969 /ORGANISM="Oxyrrhis marina" /LENGTH=71 /DNA_ID=CAMNT_0051351897 /DNA_START=80 /DNA_END=291 /DNA_ORIENTATION=-
MTEQTIVPVLDRLVQSVQDLRRCGLPLRTGQDLQKDNRTGGRAVADGQNPEPRRRQPQHQGQMVGDHGAKT